MSAVAQREIVVEISDPLGMRTRERLKVTRDLPREVDRMVDSRTDWYVEVPDVRWLGWLLLAGFAFWAIVGVSVVVAIVGWWR